MLGVFHNSIVNRKKNSVAQFHRKILIDLKDEKNIIRNRSFQLAAEP
jgi:hypothetical protein